MNCYNPFLCFKSLNVKQKIKFTRHRWNGFCNEHNGMINPTILFKQNDKFGKFRGLLPVKVPCSKCEACRLNAAGEVATRSEHELQTRGGIGAFLTLTYSDEHLPSPGTFRDDDIVDFVKRLRERLSPSIIKTNGCAEYGSLNLRQHYHLIVFGFDFPDKKYHSQSGSGHPNFTSPFLSDLWHFGHALIGQATPESMNYVARYVQKKAKKPLHPDWYESEHTVCRSRNPGLGHDFFKKYYPEIFGKVGLRNKEGTRKPIPRYYEKLLEKENPELFQKIKLDRLLATPIQLREDEHHERQKVLREIHQINLQRLRRDL